ncbi:putative membrane protein ycf1 [Cocos nucifera]|uniref:Putative membrane protein ycf1 n=1 Tax=Cocos nucifera TaxID=13894 RepID=A0A8K0N4S1_COCNU|nr:putative membrane protein ycf1 [Cocos nucifera]
MVASLLVVCAPPLLIVVLDLLVPTSLVSTSSDPVLSAAPLAAQLKDFNFRTSLVDVPIISAARSLLILCVYVVCGGRGLYLWVATLCGFGSMGYVLAKGIGMYGAAASVEGGGSQVRVVGRMDGAAMEGLLMSSVALAMAHIVVAYRTVCRERRKLLVYRIDVEAVATGKNDFLSYHKIALSK